LKHLLTSHHRYSELIFGGLIFYYAQQGDMLDRCRYAAAAGSVLVSTSVTRQSWLGYEGGILTRMERYSACPALVLKVPC
jgi:hypothetical protein